MLGTRDDAQLHGIDAKRPLHPLGPPVQDQLDTVGAAFDLVRTQPAFQPPAFSLPARRLDRLWIDRSSVEPDTQLVAIRQIPEVTRGA
jgi:hypothetical protein